MKAGKSKADTSKKADSKLAPKRKAAAKPASRPAKKGKADKDPNRPKRPPSAFFVFMEDFRKKFKEENPKNKSVAIVGRAGGEKWKVMSDAEKAPYVSKAVKRKSEYEKSIAAYNKKQSDGGGKKPGKKQEEEEEDEGDDSDKSKSEVNDDEDDDEEGEEGSDEDDEGGDD